MVNSKSAYSVAGKKQRNDTHIIVVWVDNEAGVLARVVGLFSGRGYNIESLAVAEVDQKQNISRSHCTSLHFLMVRSRLSVRLRPSGSQHPKGGLTFCNFSLLLLGALRQRHLSAFWLWPLLLRRTISLIRCGRCCGGLRCSLVPS